MNPDLAYYLYGELAAQMDANEAAFRYIYQGTSSTAYIQIFKDKLPQTHRYLTQLKNFATQQRYSYEPGIAPSDAARYLQFAEQALQQITSYQVYFARPTDARVLSAQRATQFAYFSADQDRDEFVTEVNTGLKQMKHELRRVHEELEGGRETIQKLGDEVEKANDEAKIANSKVRKAYEFMKKNKDWAFLGMGVLEFIILMVMFLV